METALFTKGLDDAEKLQFQQEFKRKSKSKGTGIFWAIGLGGIGAHRFYLDETALGILYLCLVWTGVPLVVAIIEGVFLMAKRVEAYNETVAQEIVVKLKAMR